VKRRPSTCFSDRSHRRPRALCRPGRVVAHCALPARTERGRGYPPRVAARRPASRSARKFPDEALQFSPTPAILS